MNVNQTINPSQRASQSRQRARKHVGRWVALINLLMFLLIAGAEATAQAQDNWRLYLDTVRVDQAREGSGDRPYFNVITFRSRLLTPGSTRVELQSREPNDWVSKAEYNRGLLGGRDHMRAGDQLPIPFWMGQHEFRNVTVRTLTEPDWFQHVEVFGALIISLDNNNTPPHLVRGLLQQVADQVAQVLRDQVESGALAWCLAGMNPDCTTGLLAGIGPRLDLGHLLGLTIGSTFNPDQVTGVQALIFPTIAGVNMPVADVTKYLPGGPITIGVPVLHTPANLSGTLRFEGSGARYSVGYRFLRDTGTRATPATSLSFSILTGADELREASQAYAFATLCDGREITASLNNGVGWDAHSTHYGWLTLPAGTTLGQIQSVGLRFAGGRRPFPFIDQDDNWDVEALKVVYTTPAGGGYYSYLPLLMQQGHSLQRFTASVGERRFDTGFGSLNAESLLEGLRVTIRTGGDDLRTNSQAVAVVNMQDGRRLRYALNYGRNWGNNTVNTVTLPVRERLDNIASVTVEFTSGSTGTPFEGGDNWNMDLVQVVAFAGCPTKTILDKHGAPLFRFTGGARRVDKRRQLLISVLSTKQKGGQPVAILAGWPLFLSCHHTERLSSPDW